MEFTNRRNASKAGRPARLEKTFSGSVSGASLSAPYTPRRSGKAERSRRKDNEEFYASHKFYSFDALPAQLALGLRYYSSFPCALSTGSPLSGSYPAFLLWNHIFV